MGGMRATGSEVVIVGGGIAGASAAYHLAALGRRVTLLERGAKRSGRRLEDLAARSRPAPRA